MCPLPIKPSPAIAGNLLTGKAESQQSLQDALEKRTRRIWAREPHAQGTQVSREWHSAVPQAPFPCFS